MTARLPGDAETSAVSASAGAQLLLCSRARRGGGGGRRDRQISSFGDTTIIILGIVLSFAAIGVLCWLLFTLAVFALPLFAGVTVGTWAYQSGAGWLGTILVGIVGAGLTLGMGQILLGIVRPLWARLLIALAFVAPAAIAGYHATHGIVKHTMPSETWQLVFSVIGAAAVGVTAFARVAGMAASSPSSQGIARA